MDANESISVGKSLPAAADADAERFQQVPSYIFSPDVWNTGAAVIFRHRLLELLLLLSGDD